MAEASELLVGLDGEPLSTEVVAQALCKLDGQPHTHCASASTVVGISVASSTQTGASHSGVLRVSLSAGPADGAASRLLFIKKVSASAMAHKPWGALRRNLGYARTESRFYLEFAHLLSHSGLLTPRLAHAELRLNTLLGDGPLDAASTSETPPESTKLEGAGALFLLECAPPSAFEQASPLDESRAALVLAAVARLHASAWQRPDLLAKAATRLQSPHGGSFALSVRTPSELDQIDETYAAFLQGFREDCGEGAALLARPSVVALGQRLKRCAAAIAERLAPKPDAPFATLIHGDLKAMNVMLPRADAVAADRTTAQIAGEILAAQDSAEETPGGQTALTPPTDAMLIDFASCGVGVGMSDVAMFLAHSVSPETLAQGGRERLLRSYLYSLRRFGGKSLEGFTEEVAMRHYHLAHVDYARFVIGRFWPGANVEQLKARSANRNVTLPNRSVHAALAFIDQTDRSLATVEKELNSNSK